MAIINGTPGDDDLFGTIIDDQIYGFVGNDTLSGLGGTDILEGADGNDTLEGGSGNDVLRAGAGIDHLIGGDGDDWLSADPSGGDVFEGGAGANDTIAYVALNLVTGVTVDLAAGIASGGATLSGIENARGTNLADTLTGNNGRNILYGEAGEDVLDGGGGDDALYGGGGFDIISGGDGDDVLSNGVPGSGAVLDRLDGGAGNDTVDYYERYDHLTIDLAAGTINGQALLTGIENVRGSVSQFDTITGNAQANTLIGYGDNDTLRGGDGDDRLEGGADSDKLYGDAGDDLLVESSIGTNDLLDGGDGIDTADYSQYGQNIYLDLQMGIGGNTGNITLVAIENLIGTRFDFDTLVGDGGSNVLDGLDGADSLQGGGGDDVLRGGAGADDLRGGAGSDTASYYTSTVGVTVDLAAGTGTGDAAGDTFLDIENLTGSGKGNDTLIGTAGANILAGWGGNDLLRGGAGADTLDGGVGVDTATYYASAAGVTVDLAAGTGSGGDAQGDTLIDVENLTGSNLGNDSLSGNGGANTLSGWGGDDVLRGGAGADRLDGGAGSDTASYYTGAASVTVNLSTGLGSGGDAQGDTLVSIENVNGSTASDQITGSALANALNGWAGQDVLRGGGGADRFVFTAASHTAVGAADRITDFSHAQGDRVDLSAIDANSGAAGNQAFSFIGTGLYTGIAGQLRYAFDGTDTTIAGDINGDGVSDFHIKLTGAVGLVAGDFVL